MFIGAVVCMNTHTSRWRMHFQPRVMGLLLRTRAEGQCWCSSSAFITRDFLIQTLIIFQNTIQSLTSSQGCLKEISSGAHEKLFRCPFGSMDKCYRPMNTYSRLFFLHHQPSPDVLQNIYSVPKSVCSESQLNCGWVKEGWAEPFCLIWQDLKKISRFLCSRIYLKNLGLCFYYSKERKYQSQLIHLFILFTLSTS